MLTRGRHWTEATPQWRDIYDGASDQLITSKNRLPNGVMPLHRLGAAAAAQAAEWDDLLRDRDVNRLFNTGVFYMDRTGHGMRGAIGGRDIRGGAREQCNKRL